MTLVRQRIAENQEMLYYYLYDTAKRAIQLENPCKITQKENGTVCVGFDDPLHKYHELALCCTRCNYTANGVVRGYYRPGVGCTTKSLGCAVFLCYQVSKQHKQLDILLRGIRRTGHKAGAIPRVYHTWKDGFPGTPRSINPWVTPDKEFTY